MGLLVASELRHQHSSAPSSYHLILRQSQCRSPIAPPDLKQHRVNWMGHQQWPMSPMPRLCVSMITFVIRSLCCNGSNGHFACTTTSTLYFKTFSPGAPSSMLFGGINSNAEIYFGNATASNGPSVIATIHLSTPYVNVISMGPTLTTAVSTEGEFVSAMRKRAQAEAPSPTALIGSSKSDFGYVLPFFIKFLANQSKYAAQYPQIASCLPVEPSIDPSLKQIALASNPDIDSDLFLIINEYYPPRWVLGSRFD